MWNATMLADSSAGKSEGATGYSDVNEVMHMGSRRVFMSAV